MLITNREKLFSILASGSGSSPANQPTYLITGGLSSDTLTDANVDYISAASFVIQNAPYTYGGGTDVPCPLNIANGKCYLYAGGIGFADNPPADSIVIATFSSDATKITSWQSVAAFAVNLTVNKLIENDVRLVHTNGALSVVDGDFSWADILYIELPTASAGAATQNTVAAGTVTLAANEIAYVELNRNTNTVLIVKKGAIGSVDLGPDDLVLAFYDGAQMYLPAFGSNTLGARVDALENKELYYEIFSLISASESGTITPPTDSTILEGRYPDAGDALAVKAGTDNRPIDEIARQADGTPILATLDTSGNWTINGTPDAYPICLVYQIAIDLKNIQNVPVSSICNIYETKDASEISYDDSFTGMIAPTVQDAIERLDVTRNYIAAGALEHPAHTIAVDASSVSMDSADYIIFTGGKFVKRNLPAAILPLIDGITNYIVVRASDLTFQNISDVSLIDHINYLPVLTIPRTGSIAHEIYWGSIASAPIGRIVDRFVKTRRFERHEGVMLSVNASRNAFISAGSIYYGLTNFVVDAADSSVDVCILCVETSPGVWSLTPTTTLNNTQYNGATGLSELTANRYAVNFVYRGVENPKHIYYVLGRGDYKLNEAVASQPPSSLPFLISSHSILTGRVIYQKSSDTATQLQSAYDTTFIGAGTVAHADTIGLTDGDAGHTQFPLMAGRAGGQTISGGALDSDDRLTLKSTATSEGGIELLSTATSATDTRIDATLAGTDTNLSLSIATKGNGFFAVNRTGTMGLNSYTIGGSAGGNFAISIGSGAGCAGALAVAIGAGTQGNAETCVVIGRGSGAAPGAVSAVSIGDTAACNDIFAVCVGTGHARGQYTRNFAHDGDAYALGHTTLGIWPSIDTTGSVSTWVATDRVLTVGNGTDDSNRSDAFYILKDARAYFLNSINVKGNFSFNGTAGAFTILNYTVGNLSRWQLARTNGPESGSNAGSDLILNRFADDGSFIAPVLDVNRATGLVNIYSSLQSASYKAANGSVGETTSTITIHDNDGSTNHYFTFTNGLLTFYDTN